MAAWLLWKIFYLKILQSDGQSGIQYFLLRAINQKHFIFHRASLLGHIPAPALVSAGVGRSMESGSRTVL